MLPTTETPNQINCALTVRRKTTSFLEVKTDPYTVQFLNNKKHTHIRSVILPKCNLTLFLNILKALLEKDGHDNLLSIDDELQKIHNKLYQITLGWTWSTIQ